MVGRTVSHFEILEKLGEGGMGVVWRARDTRLDRFVALKVLPAEKIADPERKRRFIQEAKAASALNHPHIVTIYEIDQTGGADFIAMEFVRGKTLEQLIPRKGLRLNEALKYAIQIADALAAAHAAGIVHRDLKPGNVMVSENGSVKVLDFGLAKLTDTTEASEFEGTRTMVRTDEGVILGTLSYMSPEQAEGKKVDARSDIFAFGALLYEMLTGQRAFRGDSRMSTIAAVLTSEPEPVEKLAEGIPREVGRIVSRCLRKQPDRRAHSMMDIKLALEELKEESDSGMVTSAAPAPRAQSRKLVWVAALAVLLFLPVAAWWLIRARTAPQPPLVAMPFTTYLGNENLPTFSPDGNQVAFEWDGEKSDNTDIYVKLIGAGRPLRLTSDPALDQAPLWSPDGRTIAFTRVPKSGKSEIFLIPALGGAEQRAADLPHDAFAECWTHDGRALVIYTQDSGHSGLFLLSLDTGEKRLLVRAPEQAADFYAALSPDQRLLAFERMTNSAGGGDLYVQSLGSGLVPKGEPKRLTSDGRTINGITWTADSREIVFASERGGQPGALWRIDPSGSGRPQRLAVGEGGQFPAISRQGNRLVYSQYLSNRNIWRVDLSNPAQETMFISSTRLQDEPRYSPDGRRIAFVSTRSGFRDVWVCDADGSNPVQLTTMRRSGNPNWSPDGRRLVFGSDVDSFTQVFTLSLGGRRPQRLTNGKFNSIRPSWSHDGKWIYFGAKGQVWKAPAGGGDPVQITRKGGFLAYESDDGQTIYYSKSSSDGGSLWQVPARGGEETMVFRPVKANSFAVARNGIYYIAQQEVRFFSFAGGTSKVIKPIVVNGKPSSGGGVAVSPDERWLLYSRTDREGSDLMLIENFR